MRKSASKNRAAAVDWSQVSTDLDAQGWAVQPKLLAAAECEAVAALYDQGPGFRSQVIMERHGFGRGGYRYFSYPLPLLVQDLRTAIYPHLAPLANRWHERMGNAVRFPDDHAAFIERCHAAGQSSRHRCSCGTAPTTTTACTRTSNGEHVFPLQVAVLLSQPGVDFDGGEFVSPSSVHGCSRGPPSFPSSRVTPSCSRSNTGRCEGSGRLSGRAPPRSEPLRSGRRHTLGVIFHDAT